MGLGYDGVPFFHVFQPLIDSSRVRHFPRHSVACGKKVMFLAKAPPFHATRLQRLHPVPNHLGGEENPREALEGHVVHGPSFSVASTIASQISAKLPLAALKADASSASAALIIASVGLRIAVSAVIAFPRYTCHCGHTHGSCA